MLEINGRAQPITLFKSITPGCFPLKLQCLLKEVAMMNKRVVDGRYKTEDDIYLDYTGFTSNAPMPMLKDRCDILKKSY